MFSCVPLVVRFGMLDDMVLLTPLLRLLHGRYGRPCHVIGSGSRLEPLLAGHPDVQDPCLVLNAGDREDLAAWLARRGLTRTKIILLQPESGGTPGRRKADSTGDPDRWPKADWIALIRALLADPGNFTVLVCGAPPAAALLRDLATHVGSPRVQAVGDNLPLRRFMALSEHAAAMISVDSGRAQVAAALGCPLIVLYGTRQPSLWRPRSPTGSPVQALGGLPARSRMDQITLDKVLFAWQGIRTWRRASASPNFPGPQGGTPGQSVPGTPQ